MWATSVGAVSAVISSFMDVVELDGSIYVTGSTSGFGAPSLIGIVIGRVNADSGSIEWMKRLDTTHTSYGRRLATMNNGHILTVGELLQGGPTGIIVFEISQTGDVMQAKLLDGAGYDNAADIVHLNPGYLIGGATSSLDIRFIHFLFIQLDEDLTYCGEIPFVDFSFD